MFTAKQFAGTHCGCRYQQDYRPWKLADDFDEDKRWGYPKWKVLLGKLTGKGRKCD